MLLGAPSRLLPSIGLFIRFSLFVMLVPLCTLPICAGIIVAIALQQVDETPGPEARSDGDDQNFERVDCRAEKFHVGVPPWFWVGVMKQKRPPANQRKGCCWQGAG